jgi:hypothetical protein
VVINWRERSRASRSRPNQLKWPHMSLKRAYFSSRARKSLQQLSTCELLGDDDTYDIPSMSLFDVTAGAPDHALHNINRDLLPSMLLLDSGSVGTER